MSREEWRRSWKPWLRGTAIGFPLGVLPMGGSVIPTFLSYLAEKRLSAHPEEFGHGAIEGVAGPEAANNAAAAGVLVPLLTLGLPSSATAAILLAAFQQYGLQPGPLLFSARPDLVWTLIASLFIGNVMLLVLNLPLAGVWARVMLLPRPLLFGGVLVLASLGAYSLNRSLLDVGLLYAVGVLGLAHARVRHPARAGRARPRAGADGRAAVPPRDGDQRGRPHGVRHAADLGGTARGSARRARRAVAHASAAARERDAAMSTPTHDVARDRRRQRRARGRADGAPAGARVLVLERAPRHLRGGNSRHTRNLRCAHDAPTEILTETYTEEELLDDLRRVNDGETDEALAALVVERVPASVCRG